MPKRKAAEPAAPDYSKMTVAELKAELTKQKLSTTGKKADLIDRLTSSSTSSAAAEPPAKKVKKGGKAAKVEPEPEPESAFSKAVASLKSVTDGAAKKKKTRTPKPDSGLMGASNYAVVGEYDCMLNQTNIGHNNNKYYIIQLLRRTTSFSSGFMVWTRWGRVVSIMVCIELLLALGEYVCMFATTVGMQHVAREMHSCSYQQHDMSWLILEWIESSTELDR